MQPKASKIIAFIVLININATSHASGANTSICHTTRTWHGKTACLITTPHNCLQSTEMCTKNGMRLFTIDDDFDMMLIFYFTIKQFRNADVNFWIKIYEHEDCVSLTSSRGQFSIHIDSFGHKSDEKKFYCEFKKS